MIFDKVVFKNSGIFFFVLCLFTFLNFAYADAAIPGIYTFQDPATPIHEGLLNLYEDVICALIFILLFVIGIIGWTIRLFVADRAVKWLKVSPRPRDRQYWPRSNSNVLLELIWTLLPAVFLLLLILPTLTLIYSLDELCGVSFTFKVIGHQWYWSYGFGDEIVSDILMRDKFKNEYHRSFIPTMDDINAIHWSFDSRILLETELFSGELRVLEVDNRLILPKETHIRVIIASEDVLHSWTLPSFGIKMDACPGRASQVSLYLLRDGVYYGQCSEICGINHAFIPICVEVRA